MTLKAQPLVTGVLRGFYFVCFSRRGYLEATKQVLFKNTHSTGCGLYCIPLIQHSKAKAGRSLQVLDQPGLCSEALSPKKSVLTAETVQHKKVLATKQRQT